MTALRSARRGSTAFHYRAPAALTYLYRRGVNDSGGEFGSNIPGTYGTDYTYDQAATLTYLAGRGHKIVRFPMLWERIQPTLGAALSGTELGRIQSYIANANAAGLGVIVDIHNYCRYVQSGTTLVLGGGTLTQAHFTDLWTRLSTALGGTVLGYGLMNEPHDLNPVAGTFTGPVRYDWNDGTVQGWTGDSATATNPGTALHLAGTATTGYWNMRKDDGGTKRGGTLTGNVLAATVTLGAGIAGTWKALLQWQNTSFSWQNSSSITYTRVDTGAIVSGLIAGVAVKVTADFTSNPITSPGAFAIQIEANDATAGAVSVDIDDFSQGSLSGAKTAAQVWEAASQAAVTAIRNNSDTTLICVGGYQNSGAASWATVHPTAWITDPASNTRYEAHLYFDDNSSGFYGSSYSIETTNATNEGYASVTARARARLKVFTDWLTATGTKGFIGEMGWPHGADATLWNAVGDAVYADCDTANLWVAYWATGEFWGTGYALTAYHSSGSGSPVNTLDAQATVLENHPSVTTGAGGGSGYGLSGYGTGGYGQ